MSKFKIGDKVVAASKMGSEIWIGLEVTHDWGTGIYECEITDPKSMGFGMRVGFRAVDLRLAEPKAKRDYVADHARRTLRAAGLSKDEAAKFVTSLAKAGQNMGVKLSQLSRKLPGPLSGVIRSSFLWSDSAEGYAYWVAIANREEEKEQAAHA